MSSTKLSTTETAALVLLLRLSTVSGNEIDILEKKDIITYRGDDLDLLMSIRRGEYQKEDGTYRQEFFDMVSDFERRLGYAKKNTDLPDNPNMKVVEEFVMEVNRRALNV